MYHIWLLRVLLIYGIIHVTIQFAENVSRLTTQFVLTVTIQLSLITTSMTLLSKHAQEIAHQGFLCLIMCVHHALEIVLSVLMHQQIALLVMLHYHYFLIRFTWNASATVLMDIIQTLKFKHVYLAQLLAYTVLNPQLNALTALLAIFYLIKIVFHLVHQINNIYKTQLREIVICATLIA